MTVLITLTTAGIDSGPFNLYSDVDGYVSAFATGIGRATLLVGYSSAAVPDGTTIIRVSSSGNCTNYIDLAVVATTTTTTTGLTTTTTTFTTTTTTTGIAYNLSLGSPDCRLNNCGDGAVCAVRYDINVDNAPVGSYLTVTYNSGNASVSLYDSSPVSGVLEYSEPDNTGTVNFTLFLRDSGGNILTSITTNLSHQSFWSVLSICPTIITAIKLSTTNTGQCSDINSNPTQNYIYVGYNETWFTNLGGGNIVTAGAHFDNRIYDYNSANTIIHVDSVYFGVNSIFEDTGVYDGNYLIKDTSAEIPATNTLLTVTFDGVHSYAITSPC